MSRSSIYITTTMLALLLVSTLAVGEQRFYAVWTNPEGEPWRNEDGDCWRDPTRYGEPVAECGDVVAGSTESPNEAVETLRTLHSEILFGFDSAMLSSDGEAAIRALVTEVGSDWDIARISVNGYTDRLGSENYNQALSFTRAQVVADYLRGIDTAADAELSANGLGESNPKVQCADSLERNALIECLAPNRRTELVFTLERQD